MANYELLKELIAQFEEDIKQAKWLLEEAKERKNESDINFYQGELWALCGAKSRLQVKLSNF